VRDPWQLPTWPDVPTRVLVTRHDRFLPVTWQAQVVTDRLANRVDETPGGRCVALSRPADLIAQLERLRRDDARPRTA